MFDPPTSETSTPAYVPAGSSSASPQQTQPGRRWPIYAGVAGFGVVLVAVVMAAVITRDESPPQRPTAADDAPVEGGACTQHAELRTGPNGKTLRCEGGKWWLQPAAEPPAPAPATTPALNAFELSPRIKSKHCFGSAGCNITFVVELTMDGPLTDGATWEVTYEVAGPEDGLLIGTFEVTGDQYSQEEHIVSVPRASTKLSVRPTAVASAGF